MKSNKTLGNYIREINKKNSQIVTTELLGISIKKEFMPSVANIIGTDLSNYKLISKNQFAFNGMHIGRDKILPIGRWKEDREVIVSPAYSVFEIIDINVLLPEYLELFIKRNEFDRMLWFKSDYSVRGGISFNNLAEVELPVPEIEKQKQIVAEYKAITNRIENNNKIIAQLDETAKTLYKKWFIDFEFPDEQGKPYKSSGGAMKESELGEIPFDWEIGVIEDLARCFLGGTPSRDIKEFWNGNIPWINSGKVNETRILKPTEFITEYGFKKSSTKLLPINTVLIAITGATLGQISINKIECCANQSVVGLVCKKSIFYTYLHQMVISEINNITKGQTGGAQPHISKDDIAKHTIIIPSYVIINNYYKIIKPQYDLLDNLSLENINQEKLLDLLLSKLTIEQ